MGIRGRLVLVLSGIFTSSEEGDWRLWADFRWGWWKFWNRFEEEAEEETLEKD